MVGNGLALDGMRHTGLYICQNSLHYTLKICVFHCKLNVPRFSKYLKLQKNLTLETDVLQISKNFRFF